MHRDDGFTLLDAGFRKKLRSASDVFRESFSKIRRRELEKGQRCFFWKKTAACFLRNP